MNPPCKLVSEGVVNALLLDIVKANSRETIANEGDIYALIACCEAGATRLDQMMSKFAIDDLDALSDYIIDTSLRGTLDAIKSLPKGRCYNTLRADGYDAPIDLHAALSIADDHLLLDFAGTAPVSAKGSIYRRIMPRPMPSLPCAVSSDRTFPTTQAPLRLSGSSLPNAAF